MKGRTMTQITEEDFKIITYEGQEGILIRKEKFQEILASLQAQEKRYAAQTELFTLLDEGFEFGQRLSTSREELYERIP